MRRARWARVVRRVRSFGELERSSTYCDGRGLVACRFFELLELRADTRLGHVQYFTGPSQAAFLGDSPEIEQMMVIEGTRVHLSFVEYIIRFFELTKSEVGSRG